MKAIEIVVERFSVEAYAPFGDPILEPNRSADFVEAWSNAWLLPTDMDGRPQFVFLRHFPQPLTFSLMERHFNVAQGFVPITRHPYLMVVAGASDAKLPACEAIRAFLLDGTFGLTIKRGVWHTLDRFPATDEPMDMLFLTELETQREMIEKDGHPEELERSEIVDLGVSFSITDPNALLKFR
ncbi:ureidoglycolate lyase [Mesorhizobium sp.]|uniref:ureidoglycolate lyase n=1 Tax=Mesorhizobium sp. TaxID=1871066 RepID=UPI000FE5C99C|nr:ureidoglycolate lyase [Mesorhizobium sp.]RWI88917.1 MAG: hypothetical protein EOR21_26380 [Mesorhizobium sp.]